MTGEGLTGAVGAFAVEVARIVADTLGERLVAVYVVGSAAVGDLQPTSDLDMAAIVDGAIPSAARDAVTDRVLAAAIAAPVRGLEFVVYTAEQAAHPDGSITLNINAGPSMPTKVGSDDDFWFAVDAAILRDTAVALVGPPAREVFGGVPRGVLLNVLDRSLQWHRDHGDRPHANVLTACRAWRFAVEDAWSSKSEAGAWAASRCPDAAALIGASLAFRRGETADEVDPAAARDFVERVRMMLGDFEAT